MRKSILCLIISCAPFLGASSCQTTANSCDGWEKLTPASPTRAFILQNDRNFAVQVGSHNAFGAKQKCWGMP